MAYGRVLWAKQEVVGITRMAWKDLTTEAASFDWDSKAAQGEGHVVCSGSDQWPGCSGWGQGSNKVWSWALLARGAGM